MRLTKNSDVARRQLLQQVFTVIINYFKNNRVGLLAQA